MITSTIHKNFNKIFLTILLTCLIITSCSKKTNRVPQEKEFKLEYEKFTLDNGLNVIFHIDKSDPVVAVVLTTHVGSAREKEGSTGIAHLFEHLLFENSENLGRGGLDKMSKRIGGSGANGSTSRDKTYYYQTVPNDALEKMIWAESEKLGYFINTITDLILEKEKQVVKNEKRQYYDNRPYGNLTHVMDKNLYPKGHPYSWQPIGSLKDVQNATLQDIKDFYSRWYTPNNSSLTISGDFNIEQAKIWVKKYFGEIKRGEQIPEMEKQLIKLEQTKRVIYEDKFAKTPELILAWPGVYRYHQDSYALGVLGEYLSKSGSPLHQLIVKENKLAVDIGAFNIPSEIAGQFMVSMEGFSDTNLKQMNDNVREAFLKFKTEGIQQSDLDRIKTIQETNFYNNLSSALSKAKELSTFDMYTGDPGFINQHIKNMLSVTPEDVMRVFDKYIMNKNHLAISLVPKGQKELALTNSKVFNVLEEEIVKGSEKQFNTKTTIKYEKTPSSFNRSIEPPYGEPPYVKTPQVWKDELSSGMKFFGIENNEAPIVKFQLQIKGGVLLEHPDKVGTSNIIAQLLKKGTRSKTTIELENAINQLGATINITASKKFITISGTCLAKNYDETVDLITEMLLAPRWEAYEFEIVKKSVLNQIESQSDDPKHLANSLFSKLIYGEKHILSYTSIGTENSVSSITIEDIISYFNDYFSPNVTSVHVVGSISKNEAINSFTTLNEHWQSKEVSLPNITLPKTPKASKIYFYDVPGVTQSLLYFGHPVVAATHPDYYPLYVLNYRLRNSLQDELRNNKGYTYNIKSEFTRSNDRGLFLIKTSVRSNISYEAIRLIQEILGDFGNNYAENDLESTRSHLTKSNVRSFESISSKISYLKSLSNYGFADDFLQKRETRLKNLTVDNIRALHKKHVRPDQMIYLVIGDAKTQLNELEKLGLGRPIILNH